MSLNIIEEVGKLQPQLVADRRYLHSHPELSFQENHTMQYVSARLTAMGISHRTQIAKTGILAEIKSEKPGKCLLIRADMDALPIEEKNTVSYGSKNKGIMHACGHDAHTAITLGVCQVLQNLRKHWCGTVKIAFQPGEETTGGADLMIKEGALENPAVDACVALHVDPDLAVGTIRTNAGAMYASPDDFYITIHGRGGHGAEPQLAIDPIVIAGQLICQLQTVVSRSIDPFDEAVVTVGSVHGGNATNVIPDTVTLSGTARALNEPMRDHLSSKIGQLTKHVCAAYGADFEYEFVKLYPPLINDPKIAAMLFDSATHCLGKENCIFGGRPTMAGEDFAYFAKAVPSAIFKLGCRNEKEGITAPIHNPRFDIDEGCLSVGAAVFTDFALRFLKD